MNELMENEQLTEVERQRIDQAEEDVNMSNLELCRIYSSMPEKQVAIAKYTGRSKGTVSKMIAVGGHYEKFHSMKHLPDGWASLYLLADLSSADIALLCRDNPPTQKRIAYFKEHGTLMPDDYKDAESISLPALEADEDATELERAANIVGDLESLGFTGLSKRAMEQARDKLNDGLNSIAKTDRKKVISFLIDYMQFWQRLMNKEASKMVKARTRALDAREERIKSLETLRANSADNDKVKIIQQILHPDRAPDGLRTKYAKGFKAFKELVG